MAHAARERRRGRGGIGPDPGRGGGAAAAGKCHAVCRAEGVAGGSVAAEVFGESGLCSVAQHLPRVRARAEHGAWVERAWRVGAGAGVCGVCRGAREVCGGGYGGMAGLRGERGGGAGAGGGVGVAAAGGWGCGAGVSRVGSCKV